MNGIFSWWPLYLWVAAGLMALFTWRKKNSPSRSTLTRPGPSWAWAIGLASIALVATVSHAVLSGNSDQAAKGTTVKKPEHTHHTTVPAKSTKAQKPAVKTKPGHAKRSANSPAKPSHKANNPPKHRAGRGTKTKEQTSSPKAKLYWLKWHVKGAGTVKVLVLGNAARSLAEPSKLPAGTRVKLVAVPQGDWFYTWGASCHGSKGQCYLTVKNHHMEVNAVFRPYPSVPRPVVTPPAVSQSPPPAKQVTVPPVAKTPASAPSKPPRASAKNAKAKATTAKAAAKPKKQPARTVHRQPVPKPDKPPAANPGHKKTNGERTTLLPPPMPVTPPAVTTTTSEIGSSTTTTQG